MSVSQFPGKIAARRLDVYVARDCFGCAEARRLAGEAAARYPHVAVRVIDLGALAVRASGPGDPLPVAEPADVPVDVVAVPTYVLDGHVIALGNPAPQHLFARLGRQDRDG